MVTVFTSTGAAAVAELPNVVLVITDDQGYGDLGCHGNPVIETPNIDRLYGESVRLENFHVGPTCAPTRAGLMTGRYCNATGVWHTIAGRSLIRKDEVTLGDYFKAGGYVTGIFGKWHLGDNYPFRPHDRGFDVAAVHGGGGVGQTPDYWGNDYFDDTYFHSGVPKMHDGYCTDVWFRLAAEFIEQNRDRPFFCYLSTNAPHSPYLVPLSYSDPYKGKIPGYRANFYGMITCIDEHVGKLRAKLKDLGIEKNTIFIFMTDNGSSAGCRLDQRGFVTDGYNAGMRGMKGWEYEGAHRVPFFLHWPAGGFTEGRDIMQLTANIDVLPTLTDLCGINGPPQENIHGTSLVPLLRGKSDWPERVIVTDSQRVDQPVKWKQSSTMTDRWRLINGEELYDMATDPGQRHDVAAEHPGVVEKLRRSYEEWWNVVSARFGEENPIIIGTEREPETDLTCHDLFNQYNDTAWHQSHIRAGKWCSGHWTVDVSREGDYAFEIRRWPKELDKGLTEGTPGKPQERWKYAHEAGKAIDIKTVKIRVGDTEKTWEMETGAKGAVFTMALKKGTTRVNTWVTDAEGQTMSAYYVYARRIGP